MARAPYSPSEDAEEETGTTAKKAKKPVRPAPTKAANAFSGKPKPGKKK